jgi:hypothetical protein
MFQSALYQFDVHMCIIVLFCYGYLGSMYSFDGL